MSTNSTSKDDHRFLSDLALALAERPRSTLQELAKAVGVSKATLYRYCKTREELIERLMAYAIQCTTSIIEEAGLETLPPLEALQKMTLNSIEMRELTVFLINHWQPDRDCDADIEAKWNGALDGFFLRGQQEGVFRIDIPAAALTEIWVALMLGLVDSERRGRIARTALPSLLERAFLHGALVQS